MSNIDRFYKIRRQLSGNSSFINNEHIDYARSYLIAFSNLVQKAFNSSLRGDVGSSYIAGFQHDRLSVDVGF